MRVLSLYKRVKGFLFIIQSKWNERQLHESTLK